MPDFDDWGKGKFDILSDLLGDRPEGVSIDEWDIYRESEVKDNPHAGYAQDSVDTAAKRGFFVKKNAHCVHNASFGFSYPKYYQVKFERYQEVFDDSFTFEMYFQVESGFHGNCFGMSATALLAAEERISIDNYVTSALPLTEGGFDEIINTNRGPAAVLKPDSELTKAVERYQIWQDSCDFYNLRGQNILVSNQTIFQQILNGIIQERKSYILGVSWESAPGIIVGHALVVDSVRKPENLGNGTHRIFLYDPNYPYHDFNTKSPLYEDAEDRYMDVNIYNGSWSMYKMQIMKDGSCVESTIGQTKSGQTIHGGNFEFFDSECIPDNFNKKYRSIYNTPRNSGNAILRYRSTNMSVADKYGDRIYRCENGVVTDYRESVVRELPYYRSMKNWLDDFENTMDSVNNMPVGNRQICVRDDAYAVSIEEGYVSYCNEKIYAGICSDDEVYVEFSEKPIIRLRSPLSASVNVVLQERDTVRHDFITYSMDIKIGSGVTMLSIDRDNLCIHSDVIQKVDVKVTTESGSSDKMNLGLEGELLVKDKRRSIQVEW